MSALTAEEARQIVSEVRDRWPNEEVQRAILQERAEAHGLTVEALLELGAPDAERRRLDNLELAAHWSSLAPGSIKDIRCIQTDPPTYEIEGEVNGKPSIGRLTPTQLSQWHTAKVALYTATGQVPILRETPGGKSVKYDVVWTALANAMRYVDVGDTSMAAQVRDWLEDYLDQSLYEGAEPDMVTKVPYVDAKGRVAIFQKSLLQWLRTARGQNLRAGDITPSLVALGLELREGKNYPNPDGSRTSADVWFWSR